jgi:CrcB protein
MKLLFYAMAGGALGSGARHLVNVGMGRWLGPGFPWWTFCVNVTGCFLMGVLIESLALKFQGSTDLRYAARHRRARRLHHLLGVLARFLRSHAAR